MATGIPESYHKRANAFIYGKSSTADLSEILGSGWRRLPGSIRHVRQADSTARVGFRGNHGRCAFSGGASFGNGALRTAEPQSRAPGVTRISGVAVASGTCRAISKECRKPFGELPSETTRHESRLMA